MSIIFLLIDEYFQDLIIFIALKQLHSAVIYIGTCHWSNKAGEYFTMLFLSCWLLPPSHFSRVQVWATPEMSTHQDTLSLGFSRQEYWSGLPFPSPMHESEKWKWSHFSHAWLLATPWTEAYQAPPSMEFSRQEYWSGLPLPSPSWQ